MSSLSPWPSPADDALFFTKVWFSLWFCANWHYMPDSVKCLSSGCFHQYELNETLKSVSSKLLRSDLRLRHIMNKSDTYLFHSSFWKSWDFHQLAVAQITILCLITTFQSYLTGQLRVSPLCRCKIWIQITMGAHILSEIIKININCGLILMGILNK